MEPRIQYAQTEDGVSIAFATMGEGEPLVYAPSAPLTHIQLEWQWPQYRRWYERLAEKRTLVRYDGRGSGLSDRNVTDFSLEARMMDLEAVVDRTGPKTFALFGYYGAGPVVITYAARHPERVSRLLLWCSFAGVSDAPPSPRVEAVRSLVRKDWELYTETLAHDSFGFSEGQQANRFAALIRQCITLEGMQAAYGALPTLEATNLLPQVSAPTLILHRRQLLYPQVEVARRLASRIPDARLALLEGALLMPFMGDMEAALSAIDEFLGEEKKGTPAEPLSTGDVHTILFTDIESSTALRRKLGDAKVQELVRAHNQIVRAALGEHAGREIKHTGDGIMASFATASSALECAIAIQRGVAMHKGEHPDSPLGVYVGLNAGEPIAEDDDLFGTSVDLAARLVDHAEPGQIVVADVVRQLAAGKDFLFADLGETELRGFEDPTKLWELRWREA